MKSGLKIVQIEIVTILLFCNKIKVGVKYLSPQFSISVSYFAFSSQMGLVVGVYILIFA